jgi:hypothetical protein
VQDFVVYVEVLFSCLYGFPLNVNTAHHAEGLVNPKVRHKKRLLISDTPKHVDSENITFLIGRRNLLYQLLKKRDFYFINVAKIGQNGPKMEFFDFVENSHFFNVIVLKLF